MAALTGLSGASGLSAVAGGVAMVPWLPTMEPSLRLWIDPSDTTGWTLNGSGNPTAMRSKAATQDVFTSLFSEAVAPTLQNGQLTVAAPSGFTTPSRLGFGADPTLFVCGIVAPSSPGLIVLLDLGESDTRPYLSISTDEYAWRYGNGNAVFPSANGAGQVLFSATQDAGTNRNTRRVRADGQDLTLTGFLDNTTTDTTNSTRLFAGWTGTLDEILAFSSTTQALIDRTEGYLAHKRGRTAQLPANHPFKNSPPMAPASVGGGALGAFITTWKTDHPGTSTSTQIDLPLRTGYTYDFVVDWGDGTSDTITSPTAPEKLHTYPTAGTYTVSITGTFPCIFFNNTGDRQKLISVDSWGTGAWLAMDYAFWGCSNVVSYAGGGNFSAIANFSYAWQGNSSVISYPLWDLSSGTNFSFAWQGNSSVISYPLWDLSSGTNFSNAWRGNSSVISYPLWDLSSGTDFSYAWRYNFSVVSYPLWDLSSGTDFSYAWQGNSSVVSYPLWDLSSGTDFSVAWQDNSSVVSYPLWDLSSGTNFSFAWRGNSSVISYPLWDLSSGTNFSNAWQGNSSVVSYPLWDLSSGTDFSVAWQGNSSVVSYPLWDLSSGTNFSFAWQGNSSVVSYPLWDLSSGTDFSYAWRYNSSVISYPLWDLSSGTDFSYAWQGNSSVVSYPLWDLSSGTDFSNAWQGNSSVVSYPLWDLSSGTDFFFAWRYNSSVVQFAPTGIKTTFDISGMQLDAAALDTVYANLAAASSQTITVTGNPGVSGDDPSIATAKGWIVIDA